MNCPQCKLLEMRVEKVEENIIHYQCKSCGKEVSKEIENKEE